MTPLRFCLEVCPAGVAEEVDLLRANANPVGNIPSRIATMSRVLGLRRCLELLRRMEPSKPRLLASATTAKFGHRLPIKDLGRRLTPKLSCKEV